jgi:hypothetical protein
MPIVPTLLLIADAVLGVPRRAALPVPCAADARVQALKLLRFHTDDERAAITPASVRRIGTVAALRGRHRFEVIEVEGYVYKASYRLRLIYAPMGGDCVLMGQEVLEADDPY